MADGFAARGVVTVVAQTAKEASVSNSAKRGRRTPVSSSARRAEPTYASHCLGGVLRIASRDDIAALAQ